MAAWGNYGIASGEARAGNLDSANEHIQRADELLKNRRILTTRVAYLSTVGFVCIQNSEYERAIEALSECLKRVQEGWLFLAFSVWSLPLLIEAHCGPNWNSSQKRPDKRLAGLCRKAKVFRSVFPELEVHITRVLARADYLYGRSQKALKRLGKAEAVARKKKLDYLLARVLLDTAAIDSNREDALRAEGIQLLKASDSVIPYAERWQLGDDPDPACFAADRSKKLLNGSSD